MLKMLARLYLLTILTYAVALYTIPDWVLSIFCERNSAFTLAQSKGMMSLVRERYQDSDQAAVDARLSHAFLPTTITRVPLDSDRLTREEAQELHDGRDTVRLGYYGLPLAVITPLQGSQAVIIEFPPPPIDINLLYWLINILIGAALLGCLGLWARPRWNDLRRLQHAAASLGRGDFDARTDISGRSDFAELGHVFDGMARDIGRLIEQQGELLGAVSHELRTPLARLEFGLELITELSEEPLVHERVEQMVRHTEELNELINELLTYTRLRSPQQRAEVSTVVLPEFISSVVAPFMEDAKVHDRHLELQLRDCPEQFTLDPRLVARALHNLLSNALRYCQTRVRVEAVATAGEGVSIRVEDDGIGIEPMDRERVFEPFLRLDRSRDRATGGFGLGLAISKSAIECQGGRLGIRDTDLGGACFEVQLFKFE